MKLNTDSKLEKENYWKLATVRPVFIFYVAAGRKEEKRFVKQRVKPRKWYNRNFLQTV